MPEPTRRASGARTITETGPPVSGRVEEAEAAAVALAVAEAVAEVVALAVAVEVAEGLAVEVAVGEAIGVAESSLPISTSGRLLAWQPSGVYRGKSGSGQGSPCAQAIGTNISTPSMDSPINSSTFLTVSPSVASLSIAMLGTRQG